MEAGLPVFEVEEDLSSEVETKVEKCFEEGTRGRGGADWLLLVVVDGAAVDTVAVVVVLEVVELARKRDCEWLEK